MSFKVLADQSEALHKLHPADVKTEEDVAWEGSPFDWFRKKASATKGRLGRDLVAALLMSAGFTSFRRGMDVVANEQAIKVRLSLKWGAGHFKFEQLRDSNYDFVFCLGLCPDRAYGWLIPKEELIDDGNMQDRVGLTPQHGGQSGTEDFWLSVNPSDVQDWLIPYGGSIGGITTTLKTAL
jgi:hypothetical protein